MTLAEVEAKLAKAQPLLDTAHGLWKAQVLSSAVEVGIFDYLESEGKRPKSEEEICSACGIKAPRARDFLNALVGMGHMGKDPMTGKYFNTEEASLFAVKDSPFSLAAALMFRGNSRDADYSTMSAYLRGTIMETKFSSFDAIYNSAPNFNFIFADYMRSSCLNVAYTMPHKTKDFWNSISSFIDIGGGSGFITIELCKAFANLRGVNTDLGQLKPVFDKYLSNEPQSVKDRVGFDTLDFFKQDIPKGFDAILFGHVIHDWDDPTKIMLIKKAYDALEVGKYIVIYEFIVDEQDPTKTKDNFLMSLHMQTACKGSQFTRGEIA
jgi:O-methyltransferase domain/Dimerisation domain